MSVGEPGASLLSMLRLLLLLRELIRFDSISWPQPADVAEARIGSGVSAVSEEEKKRIAGACVGDELDCASGRSQLQLQLSARAAAAAAELSEAKENSTNRSQRSTAAHARLQTHQHVTSARVSRRPYACAVHVCVEDMVTASSSSASQLSCRCARAELLRSHEIAIAIAAPRPVDRRQAEGSPA